MTDNNNNHNLKIYTNKKKIKEKAISKKKKQIFIIILCIVTLGFMCQKIMRFSPDNIWETINDFTSLFDFSSRYPSRIIGNNVCAGNFSFIGSKVSYLSDSSFVVLNNTGKVVMNGQHSFGFPVLKTVDNMALIYNLGGKGYKIYKSSKEIHKTDLKQNITAAAIAKNGNYAIITESKEYLSEMTVFSKNNEELYKYYFADYYINCVDINDSGDFVSVSGMSSNNGTIKSVIYTFELNSNKPKNTFEEEGNMILSVCFFNGRNFLAVGDTKASLIKGNDIKDYNYDRKKLVSFDINKKDGVCLVLSGAEDLINGEIVVLNSDLSVKSNIKTDLKIRSVSYSCDKIAVLDSNAVSIYSTSGKLKKEIPAGSDARQIKISDNRCVYILGVSEIRKSSI